MAHPKCYLIYMKNTATFSRDGAIATVLIDNPPVNAASAGVRTGIADALDRLESDDSLRALVIRCVGRTFIAGADIKEFDGPQSGPQLPALISKIEASGKPVIAAMHGTILGGGLELAIGCHARIATADARFGFPEVRLGIIPGAGGTVRMPRLAGLPLTISLAVEGKQIGSEEALASGLIDRIAEGALSEAAADFAQAIIAKGEPQRRTRDLPSPAADYGLLDEAEKTVRRRQRGQAAPLIAIEAIRFGLSHDMDEALAEEYRLCLGALASPQSAALRHLFMAERAVARPSGIDAGTPVRTIERVAVIGLGTMGRGIVSALAASGLKTVAIARSDESLSGARSKIDKAWTQSVARGHMDEAARADRASRVTWSTDLSSIADVDLVIESVGEVREVKEALFATLGTIAKPGAILASNTSYLDIDALAQASGRPGDTCGMHFFNPADVMKLVECVRGAETSPDVVASVMALAKRMGKIAVVSGVCDGFIVNRMLAKRSREAYFLLEEGASPWAIDRVLVDFGFPMGPFALGDLAGIDLQHTVRKARADRLTPREKRADFVDQLFAAGRLGRRSGAGWYAYGEDGKAQPDAATEALIAAHVSRHDIARREISDEQIRDRLILAMVNEGARLIDEGIVARPHEIDVAMVNGIGFPRQLGGPLWWAQETGLTAAANKVSGYRDEHGETYWPVSPTLSKGQFY
jgi:3-hydroxyacyl-CoA dehydrogenase